MGGEYKVGDFVTLQRGITYKGRLVGKPGPALLGLGSIVPGGGFREGDYKTYGGDCPPKLMLYPGDLFASLKGATKDGKMIGSVARVPESVSSGRLTQDTVKLEFINSDKETSDYLYWILRTPQYRDYCDRHATGSAVVALSRDDFLNYPVPPINATRKRIVSLLEFIEYKIELNRQMNATLEAMAQALFKSWFVDFDPVIDNALAAGNPIPDELQARAEARAALGDKRKPLPETIQKQFPSSFVFSEEMGWIPEGWGVKQAQDVATITIGKTPPRKETHWFSETKEGNCIWVSIKDMGNSGVFIGDSSEYLVPESIAKYNVKVVPKDSVLLSFKLTLGRVSIALSEMATNEAIAHFVSPQLGLNKEYIYCYLRNFDYGRLGSTSSIATAVNSKLIKAMPFMVPCEDVLISFEKICADWFSRMAHIDDQTDSLTGLRDTLLPKLLSGQLRIPDAEKLVAEVTE